MTKHIRRLLLFMLVCGSILTLSASPPVIGVAQSRGAFFLNHASVPGSATILEGASVQTVAASSDVSLKSGERLTLASSSSAKIYQDHMVLENGAAQLNRLSGYRLETNGLRIGASDPEAHVRVAIDAKGQVRIAALGGSAEVRNRQGLLVARVFPGTALQLSSAPGNAVTFTGIVETQGGKFFLTDETTKVKVEVRGVNLKKLVGKRVKITGSPSGDKPAADASQVIIVSQSVAIGAAAAGAAAAGAGAGAAAGGAAAGAGAAAAGISAATVAVVGGVAAAATVGGLAVSGTFSSSDTTVSR